MLKLMLWTTEVCKNSGSENVSFEQVQFHRILNLQKCKCSPTSKNLFLQCSWCLKCKYVCFCSMPRIFIKLFYLLISISYASMSNLNALLGQKLNVTIFMRAAHWMTYFHFRKVKLLCQKNKFFWHNKIWGHKNFVGNCLRMSPRSYGPGCV